MEQKGMNPNQKKDQEIFDQEAESMELLQRSKEKQGKQLRIDIDTGSMQEIDELKQMIALKAGDPEEKYNIYYTGIQNLLIKHLPSGTENEDLRRLIYDEKNVFLNRGRKKSDNGGVRKSDGRMTYQEHMAEMLDVVTDWVSKSQAPIDLYFMLYDLNEKYNYGHEKYDQTSVCYHLACGMQAARP